MENETQFANRRLIMGLAIGALLLVVVAVILIVTLVLRGEEPGEGAAVATSAKLMPEDTFSFMSFNPHLDQAKNFEVVEKAWGDNPVVEKGLSELLASMSAEGLDYKADIESWLGDEVAFSIGPDFLAAMGGGLGTTLEDLGGALSGGSVPSPAAGATPEISQLILAAAIKDQAAPDTFLNKLRDTAEQDGITWQEDTYQDIKVVYHEPKSEGDVGLAYATVDGFVVITVGGLEPMRTVIDAHRSADANLSSNQTYQDVLSKLPADQIGYGYVDMSAYMGAMMETVGPLLAELPSELFNLGQLEAMKGAGFSLGLDSNGMRVEFVALYDKEALPEDMLGTEAISQKTAGRVPADTLFYLSGSGLGNVIQMGLDAITALPDQPPDLDEQLNMLTALLGVSVEDLIDIMSGEFAIAVTHDPGGIGGDPSIPVGASFLMEATDADKFRSLLNSLTTLLALGAEMEFPKEFINDVEVTTIPDPSSGNLMVGWGVSNDFFAIGTSKELLEAAFGGGDGKLADTTLYQDAVVAPLPEQTTGVFFMNLDGLLRIVEEAMDTSERESFEQARSLLAPIKAMGAGAEPVDASKDFATGTLFILIQSE